VNFTLRYRPLWLLLFAAGAGVLLYIVWPSDKRGGAPTYTEIKPQRGEIRVTVTSTGIVQPEGRIEMKPPVPGRIERVLVREGQKVRRGQIIAWMSSTERAALLDAARAVSSEEYKRFQEYYKATPIVAPVSGTIILRNVEPGQTVAPADVLLVVADRLQVVAKVDETDIARIAVGTLTEIVLDAYPQQLIEGRVNAIAFEAKTVNNVTTYDVEVAPIAQPAFMRSGMTANVTFILREKKNVLTLPLAAIQFKNDSPFVLVKNSKGKAEELFVALGDSDGSSTEITSGLDEAQTVLVPKMQIDTTKQGSNPFLPARSGRSSQGKSSNRVH
jgi:macrolide-specific efflux system membrane fusion protein